MPFPVRKHPRLKNYDYSQCGCYHITICTKNRRPVLSEVLPGADPTMRAMVRLYRYGRITRHYIENIPQVYSGVSLDKYVIMPNHVHLMLLLEPEATVSILTIVRSLKRMVNREAGASIWQDSFYDVIIRSDGMYQCEWQYIDDNPDKWALDELYVPVQRRLEGKPPYGI